MSTPILPFAVWASGTNQNSIPANDNSLRNQILNGLVISKSVTAQPASPTDGDIYILAATHTGAQWAGFDADDLVIYRGTWYAFAPIEGVVVNFAGAQEQFGSSGGWEEVGGGGGAVTSVNGAAGVVVLDTDDIAEGSTNLYLTSERIDDRVAALLVAGTNVTLTYNDGANTLTVASTASGGGAIGKHAVPVMAGAMRPSVTGGCAALAGIASAAGQPDIVTLDFDAGTIEYAQFSIPMPSSWNEGTVTFRPIWSHTTATGNVVWELQAVAMSDDDTILANFGTIQSVTDGGGTANDIYIGGESSAITIAGTPAAGDVVFFRVSRNASAVGDTLTVDARLHGIQLFMTTDAEVDT